MKTDTPLEYMCPRCGAVNDFTLHPTKDMYKEQHPFCPCCGASLSLIAADGVNGSINLIVDELENDVITK